MKLRTLALVVAILALPAWTYPTPTPKPPTPPPITITNTNNNTNTNTNVNNNDNHQHQNQNQQQQQQQQQSQSASANNALNNQINTTLNSVNVQGAGGYASAPNFALGTCANAQLGVSMYGDRATNPFLQSYSQTGASLSLAVPLGPKPLGCNADPFTVIAHCAQLAQAGITLNPTIYPVEAKACSGVTMVPVVALPAPSPTPTVVTQTKVVTHTVTKYKTKTVYVVKHVCPTYPPGHVSKPCQS
jgi:hypothetical protein